MMSAVAAPSDHDEMPFSDPVRIDLTAEGLPVFLRVLREPSRLPLSLRLAIEGRKKVQSEGC